MKYAFRVVGIVVGVFAVLALRDATLSTHHAQDPDSRIEVILDVDTKGAERAQTPEDMATALLLTCRVEVNSDPVGPVEDLGAGRFRSVLQPSMDETDQRQFRGCLEDWVIDHVRADVDRLEPIE